MGDRGHNRHRRKDGGLVLLELSTACWWQSDTWRLSVWRYVVKHSVNVSTSSLTGCALISTSTRHTCHVLRSVAGALVCPVNCVCDLHRQRPCCDL